MKSGGYCWLKAVLFMGAVACVLNSGLCFLSPGGAARAGNLRKITDSAGRVVEIPARIERIVTINASLRFIVYMRATEMVAGVENIDRKMTGTRPYAIAAAAAVGKLPVIAEGGPGKPIDYERLITLAPDVIFEAYAEREQADAIQSRTGIPVVSLSYGDSSWCSEEVVFNSLRIAGAALGKEKRADDLIEYIKGLDRDLAARSSKIAENARVSSYIGAVSFRGSQGITSSDPEYIPFARAGAKNVALEAGGKGHVFLDREKLLCWDPKFLFIDAGGLANVADDFAKNPEYYGSLGAVAGGRVYSLMPSVFYYLNVETLYANSYFVGKTLYPELYADIDAAARADEIFEFFTGEKCYEKIKKETGAPARLEFSKNGIEAR